MSQLASYPGTWLRVSEIGAGNGMRGLLLVGRGSMQRMWALGGALDRISGRRRWSWSQWPVSWNSCLCIFPSLGCELDFMGQNTAKSGGKSQRFGRPSCLTPSSHYESQSPRCKQFCGGTSGATNSEASSQHGKEALFWPRLLLGFREERNPANNCFTNPESRSALHWTLR